jgi:DNA processing protein
MKDIHYYILHGLSQKIGKYLPLSLVDIGSVFESNQVFLANLIKKIHLSRALDPHRILDSVYENISRHKELGYECLTPPHPSWPSNLFHIPDPPHALFSKGSFRVRPRVAIIGSRRATHEARSEASDLGLALAKEGFEIVCGGAFGCDIASKLKLIQSHYAHLGTIVLPGGLLRPYPLAHIRYFDSITDHGGLIISEKFIDHVPGVSDFITRNRIIAGLSDVVILIQGDERSGSSTTVRLALSYGRDIYVSEVAQQDSPLSKRLAAEGARFIHSRQVAEMGQNLA